MDRSNKSVMIVGGNLLGKGAEAMLFTVRDTIRAAFPDAIFCVPVHTRSEIPSLREKGFVPLLWRASCRKDRLRTAINAVTGRVDLTPLDPTCAGDAFIANPFCGSQVTIDIAGFASGDQIGWRKAFGRWRDYRMARAAGNTYLFMPQSWGPFRNPVVSHFTRRLLRNAEGIFAREEQSRDYLLKLKAVEPGRIHFAPDIAFQFNAGPPEAGKAVLARRGVVDFDRPIIGMTPNRQIYRRSQGKGGDNMYLSLLVCIAGYFLDKTDAPLVLIPHEIETDDRLLCRIIGKTLGRPDRVFCLEGTESAADVKSVIGQMEFLVASRYHSLVAALSMNVPVVTLGWSHKYNELLERVGLQAWGVNLVRQPMDAALQMVLDAWEQRENIRAIEQKRAPEIRAASRAALNWMVEALKKKWMA